MKKNSAKNTVYRNCFCESEGNCPFVCLNEYGVECCSVDGIVQVRFYGCTPQTIIDKVSANFDAE